jgi:Protein of unknown function (DUF3108)
MVTTELGMGARLRGIFAAAAIVTLSAASAAQADDQAIFDIEVRGLKAGTLTIAGAENASSYAVSGRLASAGLVGMVRKVSYDATSKGAMKGGRFTPRSYTERADTGKRQSEAQMDYKGGVPQVKVQNPPFTPGPNDVDPATQGGSVDPLTALYATLRPVEKGEECKVAVDMFDGRRASRITLSAPVVEGDAVTCSGEYRRVAGFSDKDMAEKVRFPFTLTYMPREDGKMQVVEVAMESLYGRARMVRR